jgi:hypothetical protein
MVCWSPIHFEIISMIFLALKLRPRISPCFSPFFDVADCQSPTQACSLGGRKIALAPQAAVGSGKPWKGMEIMDKK